MRVGLNLVYLIPGESGGMEIYARELAPALLAARPNLELTAFINRELEERDGFPFKELMPTVTVPVNARRRTEWVRGEQQHLPRLAARAGVELVHSLASTGPWRGAFRRIVTIHDLIYRRYPKAHGGVLSLGMHAVVPLTARRSHRVIAVSNATRDDLVDALGVPAAKIDVVLQGIGAAPTSDPAPAAELRARYGLGDRPIALFVSAKRAHKNFAGLIKALALIPPERRPVLVLPGYPTPHETALRELAVARGVREEVHFLGWIEGRDLDGLYAAAACFVFPSLWEGFGLPVLEAMQRGVPVACSDRGSLPEVAGGAARMFNPQDPAEIAGAMQDLIDDQAEAERLRQAGFARVQAFSWDQTARRTLVSYQRALAR